MSGRTRPQRSRLRATIVLARLQSRRSRRRRRTVVGDGGDRTRARLRRRSGPDDPFPADRSSTTTTIARNWHVGQPGHRSSRCPEPLTETDSPNGIRRPQDQVVPSNVPAWSRLVGEHQQPGEVRRPPPEALGDDLRCQPNLRVVTPQRLLDRRDLRLDLDHEQRSARGVPCHQVDRPALAEDGKGHLGPRLPAERFQATRDSADERRMTLVHQPVQLAGAEPQLHAQLGAERPRMSSQSPHRHVLDPPAFDQRDDVLADPRPVGDVLLAPGQAMPKHPEASPQPDVVHHDILGRTASPGLCQ